MNIDEVKKTMQALLDKMDYDTDFVKTTKTFVDTYNGTNTNEFLIFMTKLIMVLMKASELNAKSIGYDELEKNRNELEDDIEELLKTVGDDEDDAGLSNASDNSN